MKVCGGVMNWDAFYDRFDAAVEEEVAKNAAKAKHKAEANGCDAGANIAFSDIALAQDFADRNIDLLRYVPLMGKWFVWDGKRWEMDVRLLARDRAKQTCRQAATQCNKSKMAKLVASARTISAVERL